MKIRCRSCGAEFEDSLASCPYCGAVNEKGAEKEYMDKLDDIHEHLSDLSDDGIEQAADTTKKTGKIITVAVIIAVIAVIVIGIFGMISKAARKKDIRQKAIWQSQNYKTFDELYDSGDYDKLFAEIESHQDDKGFTMASWGHYDFYDTYEFCKDSDNLRDGLSSGKEKDNDDNMTRLLYCEINVMHEYKSDDLLDGEKEYLSESAERSIDDLKERWDIDDSNYDSIRKEFAPKGDIVYKNVEKYVKARD